MINLIKNEFVKIFKKKSIYIILIITLGFIILSNVMYKNNSNSYHYGYSDSMLEYYEQDLSNLDPKKASDNSMYIDIKSQIDIMKLSKKYGAGSWQSNILQQYLSGEVSIINTYTYSLDKTVSEKEYKDAQKSYDAIIEKLDSNDWRYFATYELKETNKQISLQQELKNSTEDISRLTAIDSSLQRLETEKQILEWRLEKDISYGDSFLDNCLGEYSHYSEFIYTYEKSDNHSYLEKQQYYGALQTFNTSKYYIENNIRNINSNDNRGILLNLVGEYELFILIFVIMIAGAIVSDEFSKGTIKLLLVRPYSRAKILLAKFIVCLLVLILCITFIGIAQFVIGGIIQGFDSLSIPAIFYNYSTHQVQTMSIFGYIIITTLAKLPIYILLMTLAFACSTLFINTAVSIVLPLLGYMASSIINQLALAYNIKAILYFVTPNWDFTNYLWGGLPMFEGLTVPFSIMICIVYFIIMMVTAFTVFKKRNIKNI